MRKLTLVAYSLLSVLIFIQSSQVQAFEKIKGGPLFSGQVAYLSASDLAWQFKERKLISERSYDLIDQQVTKALRTESGRNKVLPQWLDCTGIDLPNIDVTNQLVRVCSK